ncbi:MAG: primosomal protein N', partial [Thermomonas sp.]
MPAPTPVLRVALPVPLPRLFDYLPPAGCHAGTIEIGQRLQVPFGARALCGIVVAHGDGEPGVDLRQALALPDPGPLLHGELLASLQWLAGYLHAPIGEVLATALPAALRRGEPAPDTTAYGWRLNEAGRTALPAMRAGKPKVLATLLERLHDEDGLDDAVPGWRASLRGLRERGLVERCAMGTEGIKHHLIPSVPIALNDEQRAAADAIRAADGFAAFLLDGVTGSGKTEVYLDAIADCLARGRQ